MTTRCPICTHPDRAAIDAALAARAAARAAGHAPAEGLGALARQHGVAKSYLAAHRDHGTPDATGTSSGGRAQPREATSPAPARSAERATLKPQEVIEIVEHSAGAVNVVPVGHSRPTTLADQPPALELTPLEATQQKIEMISKRFTPRGLAITPAVDRIYDIARSLIQREWRGHDSVMEYARKFSVQPTTIYEDHKRACTLLKLARGELVQELEVSAVRWKHLYEEALASESKTRIRDAAEALKGYDRVVGLIDQGAKVQVNVAQSPQAQDFLRIVFEALRPFPEALEAVRAGLAGGRASVGDITVVEVLD